MATLKFKYHKNYTKQRMAKPTRRGHRYRLRCLLLGCRFDLIDDGEGVNASPVKLAFIGQDMLHVVLAEGVWATGRSPDAHDSRHILPLFVLGNLLEVDQLISWSGCHGLWSDLSWKLIHWHQVMWYHVMPGEVLSCHNLSLKTYVPFLKANFYSTCENN